MTYLITFLEGIFSFLSPCMLPMLPIYLSFFAGNADKKHKQLLRILFFILGFTVTFMMLGLFFSVLGNILRRYQIWVNIVSGGFMIFFGLSFLNVVQLNMFKGISKKMEITGVFSAFLFGMVYSVNLTPCIGAFLGSALVLATTMGSITQGIILLILYSLGLGIPFLLAGILTVRLNQVFAGIKAHYNIFNRVCGIFLICIGILTAFGYLNLFLRLFI